jgi:hypothetical protein
MSAESRVIAVQPQHQALQLEVMTPAALLDRREIVQRVIEQVMVEGVHYGIVPGTRELSLLKEGAEVLLSTFHIAVEPIITDLTTLTEVRFQCECRGLAGGQIYVGSGMGVCSSNEEKYRWRNARSDREFENAQKTDGMWRIKYGRDFEVRQVRQSPWDVFQTIMSMAKKRAMVDLAKTALAASECLKKAKLKAKSTPPAGDRTRPPPSQEGGGSPTAAPANSRTTASAPAGNADRSRPANAPPPVINEDQAREIYRRLDSIGIPENAFLARFELGRVEELPASQFEAAQIWIKANDS